MGITDIVLDKTATWAETLKNSNHWLKNSTQEELLKFLNHREYLCTPGFILRRRIQVMYPQHIAAIQNNLKGVPAPADLVKCGNVPWDKKIIVALSERMANLNLNLGLSAAQWENFLTDKVLCNRQKAIKLIFALKMDEQTYAKFLISSGHDLLSMRNPFDYICKFCLKCKPILSYSDAEEILAKFEQKLSDKKTVHAVRKIHKIGMTQGLINEITSLIKDDTICMDDKKEKLIEYMFKHAEEFVDKTNKGYSSGFSLQNIKRLKILMRYLAKLYPKEIILGEKEEELKVSLTTDNQGVPQNIEELVQSLYYQQDIEFKDYSELGLPKRGKQLNDFYGKIPFNHEVLIHLKQLAATLRGIMRAEKESSNIQDITRSTVMLLSYFFITGFLYVDEMTVTDLSTNLKNEIGVTTDLEEKKLLIGLQYILNDLNKVIDSTDPSKIYISCLNWLLKSFGFSDFYPPFLLDRFILICLLADPLTAPITDIYEKSLTFLMKLVISENYRIHIMNALTEEKNE